MMNVNKMNPLAGLIANYGDSDDEVEEDSIGTSTNNSKNNGDAVATVQYAGASAAIHPSPIPHCPWSACYDETSGFTYYWNQKTNAVTWEAPPEYLLALKVAQQQLAASGSGEVTAEEWQLYQQALAEKQNTQARTTSKVVPKPPKKNESTTVNSKGKNTKNNKKRPLSDDDEEKIELITSYHNSDSESNDEVDTPVKTEQPPIAKAEPKSTPQRKRKIKTQEYGPALPPKLNYAVPIGPELPPELTNNVVSVPATKTQNDVTEDKTSKTNDDENQDESTLLSKLKDKAKLLEKLGGEIPKELQQMIQEETGSGNATPKTEETSTSQDNIDDLLEEIEKKELPKIAKAKKADSENESKSNNVSAKNSPIRDGTPPIEPKPLFPSFQNIENPPSPIVVGNEEKKVDVNEKKGVNLYLASSSERIEHVNKKKLRISNSVLPKKEPAYTTKYAQVIEGFSSERVGLGFSKDEENTESPKNAISYGNGLMFTKGETLNQDTVKEDDLNEIAKLVEKKLNFFNRQQPCVVTPLQEMMVQLRILVTAFEAGALCPRYLRRWAEAARRQLEDHEQSAAPPGWVCSFLRSEGRYCYRRESDGFVQYEYPATTHTDMDICTTPPHPGIESKDEIEPALPPSPRPAATPSPPALSAGAWRARTPPPPSWADPPPPGCDDLPPHLPLSQEPQQDIGDALASFYSDIAQLDTVEKTPSVPQTPSSSPETVQHKERHKDSNRQKERVKESKVSKKKTKVKISASVGLKHKSVSNMVAKWQQVAEEINSD